MAKKEGQSHRPKSEFQNSVKVSEDACKIICMPQRVFDGFDQQPSVSGGFNTRG
jgi:hypothetical protein